MGGRRISRRARLSCHQHLHARSNVSQSLRQPVIQGILDRLTGVGRVTAVISKTGAHLGDDGELVVADTVDVGRLAPLAVGFLGKARQRTGLEGIHDFGEVIVCHRGAGQEGQGEELELHFCSSGISTLMNRVG